VDTAGNLYVACRSQDWVNGGTDIRYFTLDYSQTQGKEWSYKGFTPGQCDYESSSNNRGGTSVQ
jgi:hypothetical protein